MAGELSGLPPIVFGLLSGMDKHGEQILGTYLYGGGERVIIDEHATGDPPFWADYMMAHENLKGQCAGQLLPAIKEIIDKKKFGKYPIKLRFHAEFPENSGLSGYELLHGSNRDVGDFQIAGIAEVGYANEPKEGDFDIDVDLHYQFNDIVDPNHGYWTDTVKNIIAKVATFGRAEAYRLEINWQAKLLIEVKQGRPTWFGYPSPRRIPLRPLPGATLDVVGLNKQFAADKERRIIEQLKRNIAPQDIKSLADRKHRLLWLCYRLAGYMSHGYLQRLHVNSSSDELARLMMQRITPQLRAECIEAIKGHRPGGVEPIYPPER